LQPNILIIKKLGRAFIIFAIIFYWSTLLPTHAQKVRRIQPYVPENNVKDLLKIADDLFYKELYYAAIYHYNKVIEIDPSNYHSYYRIAEAYRIFRLYKKAADNYNIVLEDKSDDFPLLLLWYGKMLKANGEYDEARKVFKKFIKNYDKDTQNTISLFVKKGLTKEIQSCKFAKRLRDNSIAGINNLGNNINKQHSDFAAVDIDSTTLLFTGAEQVRILKKKRAFGFNAKLDTIYANRLFEAKKEASILPEADLGKWNRRSLLDINPESDFFNLGSPAFSTDGQRLYFTICEKIQKGTTCNIWYAEKKSDKWTKSIKLKGGINGSGFSSKHPMITYNKRANQGEVLFFSSDRKGGSGSFDIWYCEIDENKKLLTPVNLGPEINTPYDEVTPFFDSYSNALFFSSNGHLGMGEYDIFMVKFNIPYNTDASVPDGYIGTGSQHPVYNIGYPINSSADDYYFYLSSESKSGYFSSNRLGGYSKDEGTCCDDIYAFILEVSFEQLANYMNIAGDIKKSTTPLLFLNAISEVLLINEDADIVISGTLMQNEMPAINTTLMLVDEEGAIIFSTLSDNEGNFQFQRLPPKENYFIMLDEDNVDLYVEIEFMDNDGNLLKTINSNENVEFFEYEKLTTTSSNIALFEEDFELLVIEEDFVFNLTELLNEEQDVIISGTLKNQKGEATPNTMVMLLNEEGYIIDSTLSDKQGNFEFQRIPGKENYFVMLDENYTGMNIEVEFINKDGEVLLTANSDDNKELFRFEKLTEYRAKWTLLKEEEDFSFKLTDLLDEEGEITISGKLKNQQGKVAPNTMVMLLNEEGYIIDSTLSDKKGNFEFQRIPGKENYFVMLDENYTGMNIEVDFTDNTGKVLLSLTSDNTKGLFKYERLTTYRAKMALLAEEEYFSFNLTDFLEEENSITISGTLSQKGVVAPNTIVMLIDEKGNIIDSTMSDKYGNFKFQRLPGYKNYFVMLDENYVGMNVAVDFTDNTGKVLLSVNSDKNKGLFKYERLVTYRTKMALLAENEDFKLDVDIEKVLSASFGLDTIYEEIYALSNVYFDFNKANLRADSYTGLKELYNTMKKKDKMVIEIAGHTDNVGTDKYNLKLSQSRADNVRNYLIQKGIDLTRLIAKGYAAAQPIAGNDTEINRQKNRRVEIRIISK